MEMGIAKALLAQTDRRWQRFCERMGIPQVRVGTKVKVNGLMPATVVGFSCCDRLEVQMDQTGVVTKVDPKKVRCL
jgi:hypothetical protein